MAPTFVAFRNGGETDEEGVNQTISQLLVQGTPNNNTASSMQCLQHAGGANMSVDVQIGNVVIQNSAATYSYDAWTTAVTNVTIGTAPGSNSRIDTVVAYINLSVVNNSNPNNPGALAFMDVAGTVASSPVAPSNSTIQSAVGAGTPWTPLANIAVGTSVTSIVSANITDTRYPWAVRANVWGGASNTLGHTVPNVADDTVALLNASQTLNNKRFGTGNSITTNGWQPDTLTYTYSANNGNKEFVVTPSASPLGFLQAGTKVSYTRGTVPPTQCASFASASSQYGVNTSPSGITFTSAFTCEAWIYLLSYPSTSQAAGIISRSDNSTGGWQFNISEFGQLEGVFGSSSSFTTSATYQSVPLKEWVHVAFVVSNVSSKTVLFYINGTSAPFSQSGSATTLTQTGNLEVAAIAGVASSYLNGYVAEARVWSAAQSQANVEANMGISISGSAANLVTYYQFNGNANDGTSNANNLTLDGGASVTQAANPYNAVEHAFVTKVTSGSVTLKAIGGTIPNMTLSSPQYSYEDAPFGWPSVVTSLNGLKLLKLLFQAQQTTTATSNASFGGSSSTAYWPFTTPTNCGNIKVKVFNTSYDAGSGTAATAMQFFDGTTPLSSYNQTSLNGYVSVEILLPTIGGSVINFNIAWLTTAGTANWSSSQSQQGVTVEAA